jgi:hypothetical protein
MPPTFCPTLAIAGPSVGIAGATGFNLRQPALSYSSDDRQRITVLSEWIAVEGPAPLPFSPWATLVTSDLSPSYLADFDGGVSFDAAPSSGDRFAILFSDGPKPAAPYGVYFSAAMQANMGTIGPKVQVDAASDGVLFTRRARSVDVHLNGYLRPGPGGASTTAALSLVEESSGSLLNTGPVALGCAASVPSADAVTVTDGWLLAIGNGSDFGEPGCLDNSTAPISASTMQFGRVDMSGSLTATGAVFQGDVVRRVRGAPHPNGGWFAWINDTGSLAVNAVRLDDQANLVGAPVRLSEADEQPDPIWLEVAALDDHLLVVWARLVNAAVPKVVLQLLDEGGTVVTRAEFDAEGPNGIEAVIASPDGDSVVLAESQPTAAGDRVRLTRVDCQ